MAAHAASLIRGTVLAIVCFVVLDTMSKRRVATLSLALQLVRGALMVTASLVMVIAFRTMPLADATAINYTSPTIVQLVFATLLGLVAFGDFPDGWTLLGMLVIAASGLFLTLYERRRHFVQMAEPPAVD